MSYKVLAPSAPITRKVIRWRKDWRRLLRGTRHALKRMAQRGRTADDIVFAYLHGTNYKVGDRDVYFLRHKDIDDWEGNSRVKKLAGITLITASNGKELITIYQSYSTRNKFKMKWGHCRHRSRKRR